MELRRVLSRQGSPKRTRSDMLYYSMKHRTQLYLDDGQYRWLKQQAGERGSIAAVVRDLIETARSNRPSAADDPLVRYLLDQPPGEGDGTSSVSTLDRELYG